MWAAFSDSVHGRAKAEAVTRNWGSARQEIGTCEVAGGCAHRVMSTRAPDSNLKRWGLRLCERGGKNSKRRAIVAVARKLSVLLHKLWITGETYHPLYGCRCEAAMTAQVA